MAAPDGGHLKVYLPFSGTSVSIISFGEACIVPANGILLPKNNQWSAGPGNSITSVKYCIIKQPFFFICFIIQKKVNQKTCLKPLQSPLIQFKQMWWFFASKFYIMLFKEVTFSETKVSDSVYFFQTIALIFIGLTCIIINQIILGEL